MNIHEFDTIALDLDENIWNGMHNTFWAKLLVQPLRLEGRTILDRYDNYIRLQDGIDSFLMRCRQLGKTVYFITRGGYLEVPLLNQPATICLEMFGIMKYFNGPNIVGHYTHKKSDYFREIGRTLYIDDDQLMIDEIKPKFPNVTYLNRLTDFKDWSELC